MEAVQIFSDTASTTEAGSPFGEQIFNTETLNRVTVWRNAEAGIQEAVETTTRHVSDKDFAELLDKVAESIGEFVYSLNTETLLSFFRADTAYLTTPCVDRFRIVETLRSLVAALLMPQLEAAAEAGDERAFVTVKEAIEWSAQPAEDFIKGIQLALRAGAFSSARQLSVEGAELYPEDRELQKYARVLAPPRVIRSDLPPTPSVKANREWLKKHGKNYRGRWVGLRNGNLVDVAKSFDELVEKVGSTEEVLLTRV